MGRRRDFISSLFRNGAVSGVADVTGLQSALDGKAAAGHAHAASDITSGTIAAARLGSGTASGSTFLRGDQAWETPAGGGGGSISSESAALSADVSITASNTFYDGPEVSLAAGTWLVMCHATYVKTATGGTQITARLTDGTNHHASQTAYHTSNASSALAFSFNAVVTLGATTTLKIQMAAATGNAACRMKAAAPSNASGDNATMISAIKIA